MRNKFHSLPNIPTFHYRKRFISIAVPLTVS